MDLPMFDFALASLLMGLGIGFDVAIATVARAKQLHNFRIAMLWIIGVSATHTLFPMIGYLLAYFSVQLHPSLAPIIGIIAFTCIFLYLNAEIKQLSQAEQESNQSQLLVTLGLILAVSWDALWSGPAKSAQVIGWPELMVWGSFILVGAMVSILAIVSLKFSRFISQYSEHNRYSSLLGYWVQYSVIGYFGLLAVLRYTLQANFSWWQILLMAFAGVAAWMSYQLAGKVQLTRSSAI